MAEPTWDYDFVALDVTTGSDSIIEHLNRLRDDGCEVISVTQYEPLPGKGLLLAAAVQRPREKGEPLIAWSLA